VFADATNLPDDLCISYFGFVPIRAAQGFALRDSGAAVPDINDGVSMIFERPISNYT
jgi:hypothetical protein